MRTQPAPVRRSAPQLKRARIWALRPRALRGIRWIARRGISNRIASWSCAAERFTDSDRPSMVNAPRGTRAARFPKPANTLTEPRAFGRSGSTRGSVSQVRAQGRASSGRRVAGLTLTVSVDLENFRPLKAARTEGSVNLPCRQA